MKCRKISLLIGFGILMSGAAFAEISPQSYPTDQHVQYANYDPHQVYRINSLQGYITSIQFGTDEKILSVNIGDSSSWLISIQNEVINLKPTADLPNTNLNVLTSRGSYQFLLVAPDISVDNKVKLPRQPRARTTFLLQFKYPAEEKAAEANKTPPPEKKNWFYSARGNPNVAPISVFDDGHFTFFNFGDRKDIPAIFSVDFKGQESIINYHLQDSLVVVETTAQQFTLRNGDQIANVFNDEPILNRE